MKIIHRENYKNYIICVVAWILSFVAFPYLPEEIPIHFNVHGVPDGYGSTWTIFLLPAIMVFVNILAEVTKHADPKGSNYAYFMKYYYQIFLAINIFFLLLQLYIISYSLEIVVLDAINFVQVAIGILFVILGHLLPKVKQNFFLGIKTPWTLADEHVWCTTHCFSGKLWFVLGLLMCICGFLPKKVATTIAIIVAVLAVAAPVIYSYIVYKKQPSGKEE